MVGNARAHEQASLLRFATAGSVDDGKSTLIGRLLYDAKGLFEDQVEALERDFDLAQLTDGLRAERAQGITIDVAHRYFATPRRRFMIADCPGHAEYTRNALTGMSAADVVVLLVDARVGPVEQTRRHAHLAALLGLDVIVCVNKMDLVGFARDRFRAVEADIRAALAPLGLPSLHVVPISALGGENVVDRAPPLAWYPGRPLLEHLETFEATRAPARGGRMFVQLALRPATGPGRWYAGRVGVGRLAVGDEVVVLPRGTRTRISAIETYDGPLEAAEAPLGVRIAFDPPVDADRGDLVAAAADAPEATRRFSATLTWMGEAPLEPGALLWLRAGSARTRAVVRSLEARLDLERLELAPGAARLAANEAGRVVVETFDPLGLEPARGRPGPTERFILVDPSSRNTVGVGIVGGR